MSYLLRISTQRWLAVLSQIHDQNQNIYIAQLKITEAKNTWEGINGGGGELNIKVLKYKYNIVT